MDGTWRGNKSCGQRIIQTLEEGERGEARNITCHYAKNVSEKIGNIQIRFGVWLIVMY